MHVLVFGVLAGLILLSTPGFTSAKCVFAITVTIACGAIDEWHQGHAAGRSMDVWDLCSDGLGACSRSQWPAQTAHP